MNMVGFDTSTPATTACLVLRGGGVIEHPPAPAALQGPPAHAAELLPALHGLLTEAGIEWSDVGALAVGVGPGTFTGLRIGLATARGLALATGMEVRPVCSLAALAAGIGAPRSLAVTDARRGEVFASLTAGGAELWPPFAAAPIELARAIAQAPGPIRAAGGGALRFRAELEAAGAEVAPQGSPDHLVRAPHVCELAREVAPVSPGELLPNYLRPPDAIPST